MLVERKERNRAAFERKYMPLCPTNMCCRPCLPSLTSYVKVPKASAFIAAQLLRVRRVQSRSIGDDDATFTMPYHRRFTSALELGMQRVCIECTALTASEERHR